MKLKQILLFLLLSSSISIYAQHTVKGTVYDNDGDGIPAATIMLKKNHSGTLSDLSGAYQIQCSKNDTLIFKSYGFDSQEIEVLGKTIIDVTMHKETKRKKRGLFSRIFKK